MIGVTGVEAMRDRAQATAVVRRVKEFYLGDLMAEKHTKKRMAGLVNNGSQPAKQGQEETLSQQTIGTTLHKGRYHIHNECK